MGCSVSDIRLDAEQWTLRADDYDERAETFIAPSRATQQDWEQPGCLHANMDLHHRGQIGRRVTDGCHGGHTSVMEK